MIIQSDILAGVPNLIHGSGVVKACPLVFKYGDDFDAVVAHRRELMNELGIRLEDCVFMEQVHGARVRRLGKNARGSGIEEPDSELKAIDAMMTDEPNVFLVAKSADCVPVFLYDPKQSVVALVHAGWSGTIQEIALKTIRRMSRDYKTNPADLFAYCGPAIGRRCYSIDHDLERIRQFQQRFGESVLSIEHEQLHLDLRRCNRLLLEEAGVEPESIEMSDLCTHCDEHLPSYQREKRERRTAILNIIGLRP
ncbi:MAG: peptidoglycan editing factor PgeF [Candidatus Kerfeldbacteria bacterium]|nr:peptidoglycan editing factor PgeF [Candidatus Kerfeldbacteria bacterium]